MIHPRLATMLVVITTDYPLAEGEAETFLRPAVERSFNRISVDGDCSTNDAVVLLANGASGADRGRRRLRRRRWTTCAANLARQIVADGEGATVVLEIGVNGAATDGGGRGDRAPDRDVAARQDGGVRPRSELGPGADGGRLGPVRRRLRATRHRPADGLLRRRRRVRRRVADRHRAGARRRRSAGSISTSGSVTARPAISRPTSPTTTSGSTRSTRREPDRAQARRPGRRRRRRPRRSRCAERARGRRRPRGRAADHGRDGAAGDRTDVRRRAGG